MMDPVHVFRRRLIGLLWLVTCVSLLGWGLRQLSAVIGVSPRTMSIVLLDEGPQGLQAGADVVLGGVVIGKLTETRPQSHRMILTAQVLDRAGMLDAFAHADSYAIVRRKLSGFGGSYVEISGGKYGKLEYVNYRIPGFSEDDPNQEALALLPQAQAAVQNLADMTTQIRQTLVTATSGKGLAGRLMSDETLANNVADTAADIKTQQHDISRQIQAVLQQTADTEKKLDQLLGQIQTGKGVAGALLSDDQLAQSVKATIEQLQLTLRSIEAAAGDVRNSGLIRFGNPGGAGSAPGARERAAEGN